MKISKKLIKVGKKIMKKQTTTAFNKKIYLLGADKEGVKYWLEAPSWDCGWYLGADKEGVKYWLEAPSWDCGWYWGFGYIETYTNNNCPSKARDIKSLQHFNSLFLENSTGCAFDAFNEFFKETTLSKEEVWMLVDYMISFYRLRKAAETLRYGFSYQTERAKLSEVQNIEMAKKINEEILPAIFKQIDSLLSE